MPKLAVLIVVDQMRADYVDLFRGDWSSGLKRLFTEGAVFRKAAYPYLNTVTCPGHATIATGVMPRTHGMIQNTWWDRQTQSLVTCTSDPSARAVLYGKPVAGGDSAHRLAVPTWSDFMRSERGARVVTLSLKDRSAIMMAGRAGHAVTWLDVAGDRWVTSSAFTDAPLPQVKAFIDAHPIEADYGKTWKKLLPPASYRQTDDSNEEAPPPGWSRSFPHVLNGAGKGPDFDFYYQWQRSPFANDYLAELAMSLVDSMQLGQREATDVLGISFSATDLVGHAFGPSSHEVQDVYAHLDQTIGSLLTRLDAVVGPDRYVVALSADHGVTPIPEQLTRSGENAGRFDVTRLTSAITARMQAIFGSGRHLAQVNGNDVYFAPGIYEKLTANPKAHAALLGDVKTVDGIADVYPADLLRRSATASDSMLRAAALSYFPGRSGDLVVALKPGWMSMASGTTHGSRNPDDQRVPLLFYGSGVRRGVHDDAATPADIAPTLSALCGLTMPKVEGRVLRAALNERRN